jgi:UDP-N-acetylglucosamine diphosphorylase/glucosamine-1-phosphate N-acetyltransferase
MKICIFEDAAARWLEPLSTTRPVWDLMYGPASLFSRILESFPADELALWCRPQLAEVVGERHAHTQVNGPLHGEWLLVNARWLRGGEELARRSGQWVVEQGGLTSLARVVLKGEGPDDAGGTGQVPLGSLTRVPADVTLVRYLWDLVDACPAALSAEASRRGLGGERCGAIEQGAILMGGERITLLRDTVVGAGAVLDARPGAIWINEGATIGPLAVVEGPLYLGRGSVVNAASRLRGGCVLGPGVKVGGEIENTIMQGYANKQHDGFLGHSYVGSWVNLGAGTTNSDLKNNYRPVRVTLSAGEVATGKLKVGLFVGDHCTTGIGTLFTTGSVVGAGSNLYGGGLMPKYVGPLSWGTGSDVGPYRLPEFLEATRTMMSRRGQTLSPAYERLLRELFRRSTTTEDTV